MRICIVYDSRRGSTARVAEVIGRALKEEGAEVSVKSVNEDIEVENCDLVIIGAPIYYERPLPGIVKFVEAKNGLEGKKVAVFILCIADRFGRLGKGYTERRYVGLMLRGLKTEPIGVRVFDGWIFGENEKTLKEAGEWAKRLMTALKRGEKLGIEHPG